MAKSKGAKAADGRAVSVHSPFKSFIRECLDLDPIGRVTWDDLRCVYEAWCIRNKCEAASPHDFNSYMRVFAGLALGRSETEIIVCGCRIKPKWVSPFAPSNKGRFTEPTMEVAAADTDTAASMASHGVTPADVREFIEYKTRLDRLLPELDIAKPGVASSGGIPSASSAGPVTSEPHAAKSSVVRTGSFVVNEHLTISQALAVRELDRLEAANADLDALLASGSLTGLEAAVVRDARVRLHSVWFELTCGLGLPRPPKSVFGTFSR